jgi:hypothetical protein
MPSTHTLSSIFLLVFYFVLFLFSFMYQQYQQTWLQLAALRVIALRFFSAFL